MFEALQQFSRECGHVLGNNLATQEPNHPEQAGLDWSGRRKRACVSIDWVAIEYFLQCIVYAPALAMESNAGGSGSRDAVAKATLEWITSVLEL